MTELYCGNNRLAPGVRDGTKRLGDRYSCLRKGVGVGLNLPLDPEFAGPYEPIDNTKYYCGKATQLPDGYDRFGSLPKCFQTGVGTGKRLLATGQREGPGGTRFTGTGWGRSLQPKIKRYVIPIAVFVTLAVGIFAALYFAKPRFVTKKVGNKHEIDWGRFAPYYALSLVGVAIIAFLVAKFV